MDELTQAQTDGVVVGLKNVADVVPRKDVDELLLQEPDTFNLFLLALRDLQQDPNVTDIMSYYQIAGIHGLPKALWDGVDLARKHSDDLDPNDWSGYCSHGTVLFPTWHRPYLAMIEQTFYSKMLDIAKGFGSQADRYRQAAQKFRLPYWDYFRPRAHRTTTFPGVFDNGTTNFPYDFSVPQIFTLEQIMIDLPGRGLTLQPNPLNFFTFPTTGIPDEQFNVYARGFSEIRTLRYPSPDRPDQDDSATMNDTINKERESNVQQIINMVSDPGYQNYRDFATNTQQDGSSGSLEDIHGTYHGLIGGPMGQGVLGHMATVPVAAFDPIFWFHHCQIDRWAAIWQAIHPGAWFDGGDRDLEIQDLLPFRTSKSNDPNDPDTFWNSQESRKLEPFGYTYPDVQFGSPDEVKAEFSRKYEWSFRVDGVRDFGDCPPDMQPLDLSRAQVYQFPGTHAVAHSFSKAVASAQKVVTSGADAVTKATTRESAKGDAKPAHALPKAAAPKPARPAATKDTAGGGKAFTNLPTQSPLAAPKNYNESKISREWFVDIVVERLALNGPFTIYYFIGPFSNNINDYNSAPTMAGISHIFVAPVETCDNCGKQAQQGFKVTSTASVTAMLMDYVKLGELENLTPDKVKPFLVQWLRWRVVDSKGERIDPRTVKGLKVGISSKLTPIPLGSGHVTYEEFPETVEEILGNAD